MNKKIYRSILAIMLVITLTFAHFLFLAVYAGKSYAASVNYEAQETSIDKTDVSFDSYFITEEGKKTHTKVTEMNNSELKLFLSISVTKGYLQDAVVSIENSNFKLVKGQELPNGVESIDAENNRVTLNQISKGEIKEIALQIEVLKDEKFALDNFSKDAEVKLTGNFVNNNGKQLKTEKAITVNLAISEDAESYLSGKISKYAIFEEEGSKKALLQLKISSKVVNNLLPVKSTEISLNAPTLFGIEPENVSVASGGTRATNGDDGTTFNNNYSYLDGIITILVPNNPDEEGRVSWAKNSIDEYMVNLIYSLDGDIDAVGAPFGSPEETDNKIYLEINSKLSLYNNEEKEIEKQVSGELKLPEASKSVVSYEISNETKEIAKGYMLVANADVTELKQEIKVNIGHNTTVNNIEINKSKEYYTDEKEKIYTANTYYREIKINRENLIKILGENGTINLISNGVTVGTLNKENTSYIFSEEISDLMILTSAPEQNGVLTIETTKYIKAREYEEKIISSINKLTTTINGKANFVEEEVSTEISLVQPTLQISSEIKNNKLSTVIENKNVEMRVALQTNNNTNRLFKNPIVEIELPAYIEAANVIAANVMYNEELQAAKGNIITNNEGNKVIRVELVGEQTKFNDIPSVEGSTLILGLDIKVAKTAPSITEKVKVRVINNGEEVVETSSNITYMAPTGIITLNSISGYNETEEELTSISGEEEVGKIDVAGKAKIATERITVINNNDYTCGDIEILGRTPAEGNKSLAVDEDLGSTFTAKMVSGIKEVSSIADENVSVYYSENGNATKDLNDTNNGWTQNVENLGNVKSYLIAVNKEMEKGNVLEFSYDIEIPEGLSREESTYSTYQVSYTNLDGALKGARDVASAPKVGLSTGAGPELKVELSANVPNETNVKEGQIIEYTIKVTNIGKVVANNITVEADIPKESRYTTKEVDSTNEIYVEDSTVRKYTETIESIAVGESKETKFLLTVGSRIEYNAENFINREDFDSDEEYQFALSEMQNIVSEMNSTSVEVIAKAETYDNEELVTFTSNKMTNEKVKGYFDLALEIEDCTFEEGTSFTCDLIVKKLGNEEKLNNVQITFNIPDEFKYSSSTYDDEMVTQDINNSTITWTINEFTVSENIRLTLEVGEVKENKDITIKMQGTCNEHSEPIESNVEIFSIGIPKLEISHSSNNNTGNITEGDEIVYTITVKNTGTVPAYNVKVTDYLSDGLSLKTLKYTLGKETNTYERSEQKVEFIRDIPKNETLVLELIARADELKDEETSKTVSNRFEVEAIRVDKLSSSQIEHKVNKKIYKVDENGDVVETNSISGLAWLDADANGIREPEEKLLSEIPVILINEEGKTIASGITNEKGEYRFDNLPVGNYIVVFLYDMANYDVTAYGVGEVTTNNDAVTMNVKINDISTPCAATNVIRLISNIYNIDLGLVENPKFDLSLTKTISKISVQTSKGTTTTNYNDSKLQKVEIPSKNLEGAIVTVEYNITVTNNGAIPGYASRIVDYLSSTDLKFNSETNKDWYLGTDGNVYNSSLGKKLLNPGESATLKLVLSKKVSESNTGLTTNTAEIYEAYNDQGLEDYNSTPGNKAQNENDLGQADIIIGPKTGVILYIGFAIALMSIMAVAIYVLNKKVIKNM